MEQKELLSKWIQEYYERLTYVAFTYVRDQSKAEDLVQQSFINAYLSINQLKDVTRPYPWLLRIVINQCLNANRTKNREQTMEIMPEEKGMSTEDIYMKTSLNKEVYAKVLSLPEKLRTPIILFYFEELSIREIADALKLSEGAVKTRLSRGRDRLKTKLKGANADGLGDAYSSI